MLFLERLFPCLKLRLFSRAIGSRWLILFKSGDDPGQNLLKKMKKEQKENRRGKLGEFMGHSVVSVIRSMGLAGWSVAEAQAALAKHKITPAKNTLYIQLRAGAEKKGKLADIDFKKLEALRPEIRGKIDDKAKSQRSSKARKASKAKKN
jgi:hypothetical protein